RLAAEIARVVGPETIVVGDGGDVVACASKIVAPHGPGQWLDPGPLGCLGVGPSFALTAKLLHPERPVILIAGDGALGLNGMELETAVRFRLPLVCVVGNDGGWGQIRNPQLSFYGEARAVATSLPLTRFAGGVRAILTYADRLVARGHDVTLSVPAKGAWRAVWLNARGAGPDWIAGFRPRVTWVMRWDAGALPEADVLLATAWQSAPVV